jgi:2-polyprenyl-6-methoxyphenol hydroxylase-like FAD-dependent oxidoreductase
MGPYSLIGDRVHWFLSDPAPEEPSVVAPEVKELPANIVEGLPSVAREALAATPLGSIGYEQVRDLAPYERWGTGRVTLIGDAAHPMLPRLGQGACQAIEDAAALASRLGSGLDVEAAPH